MAMISVAEVYTSAVHHHLKPFFANWEPARPLQLGDYGILSKGSFNHLSNISTLGIKFTVRQSEQTDRKSFSSSGSTNVSLHAQGSAQYARATVEIQFGEAEAVFFNAAECHYSMIADKIALGRSIMGLLAADKWQRSWVIITEMVTAGATTIAVSGGNSSSLILEAVEDVPYIDLADASVGLKLSSAEKVGYHIIGKPGLTPLIALSAVQRAPLRLTGLFVPLMRTSDRAEEPEEITAGDETLYFGDLADERQLA